jgi:hypothetical protein
MRLEQKQVLDALRRKDDVMQEKDDVIRRQRSAIEDLASRNDKLLTALKEVHGYSGGNGILSSSLVQGTRSIIWLDNNKRFC